jgi:osmoprotectant transport system ATP-binding protein
VTPNPEPTVALGAPVEEVRRVGGDWLLVVDEQRRPLGWVEPARIRTPLTAEDLHRGGTVARLNGSSRAVLDAALSSPSRRGVLVDDEGRLLGTVTLAQVATALEQGSV